MGEILYFYQNKSLLTKFNLFVNVYSLFYAKKNLEQANTYFVYLNIGYFSTKLF